DPDGQGHQRGRARQSSPAEPAGGQAFPLIVRRRLARQEPTSPSRTPLRITSNTAWNSSRAILRPAIHGPNQIRIRSTAAVEKVNRAAQKKRWRPVEKGSGAGPPRSRATTISTRVITASTRIGIGETRSASHSAG